MLHAIKASTYRLEREHNARAWLAWNTVALGRAKRLPPLEKLLIRRRSGRQQTPREQMQIARMITAAFGGKINERR